MVLFFSIVFAFLTNIADFYPLFLDPDRWVPVNTPPLAIGDEYHYFSVLKLIAFGEYFGIPYDSLNGTLFVEFSRIVPYILDLPIYYAGTICVDTRYGILFVRLFNSILLYFAMHYLIQTVNRANNWKNNIYLAIGSVFLIFYGFYGLNTFFIESNILLSISNFFRYFGYLTNETFIYNNSVINDLSRAIIASATAPIIIFSIAFRLSVKELSLAKFMTFLLILGFTNLPIAIAFGLISLFLDLFYNVDRYKIIQNLFFGSLLGGIIVAIQTKLIFGMADSAREVMEIGSLSFGWGYLSAPLIVLTIFFFTKKHLSRPIVITLFALSLFQPLAFIILGEHGSRFWLRSTIIPFLVILIYVLLVFVYFITTKILEKHSKVYRIFLIISLLLSIGIIGRFTWINAEYIAIHKERFINNPIILSYIFKDKEPSIVVTNSTQVAMLIQIYDQKWTPLMSHFSLQSLGYKEHWTKTLVNFELLGIPSKTIIEKINNESPQLQWLTKRQGIENRAQDFENFYFDELLFVGTYATYNHQMLHDRVITKDRVLENSFYTLSLDRNPVYNLLKNKQILFIIDKSMPLAQTIDITKGKYNMSKILNVTSIEMNYSSPSVQSNND